MLVSHKYKFIFIKTGKVGGTSLEMALSRFMGPDDIITPLSVADEVGRYERGFRAAQNYEKGFADLRSPREVLRWARGMLVSRFRTGTHSLRGRLRLPKKYRNHMDARSIKALVGDDVWESYFKFSVDRNPWDKTVSQFYWDQKGTKKGLTFRDYVLSGRGLKSDFERYTINGILAVDKLIRYDRLYEEMDAIGFELGLPGKVSETLQGLSAKGGFRKTKEVAAHYDEETRRAVDVYCARENRLLGFRFEDCP